MSLLDELHPGSYKGIEFLINTSNLTGGRKTVKHAFPNSDLQTVEDLGLAPKIFNLNVTIAADRKGENYITRRDSFIQALESQGAGTLQLPFYGQLPNYASTTYTVVEDLVNLGQAMFNIVFELSSTLGVPKKAKNTTSIIEAAKDAAILAAIDDFAIAYKVTTSARGNFSDAVVKLNSMIDSFTDSTASITAQTSKIDAFAQELSNLSTGITTLIQTPRTLATSISNLYSTINNLYPTVTGTIDVLKKLFNFGDDDTAVELTTFARTERSNNRRVLSDYVQLLALTNAYFNTAQETFGNVDDLDAAADALETQYEKIIKSDGLTIGGSTVAPPVVPGLVAKSLSDVTKSALTDMRTDMQQLFDEQRLIAKQVVIINTNLTSARLLAYQYYADSSKGQALIDLNKFKDVSFVAGDVKVLST